MYSSYNYHLQEENLLLMCTKQPEQNGQLRSINKYEFTKRKKKKKRKKRKYPFSYLTLYNNHNVQFRQRGVNKIVRRRLSQQVPARPAIYHLKKDFQG